MSKYGKFWEMKTRNPFAPKGEEQMFKCTDCGAESFPDKGWDGSPNTHKCSHDCKMDHSSVTSPTSTYKENLGKIFPNSPGADI